jgi:hypothetical protein
LTAKPDGREVQGMLEIGSLDSLKVCRRDCTETGREEQVAVVNWLAGKYLNFGGVLG